MNPELLDRAPEAIRAKVKAERHARRGREQADALDFLVYGDLEGRHASRCVHPTPCSRDYDPTPYPEAIPADQSLYEGTGIAALYGLPGGEAHLWRLAGWNVRRGS